MDIRELQYFVQVADIGNYSLAAEKLYISQPALSKVVQKLEIELGCDLFYADQRQQKLTGEGLALYEKARRVLREFDEVERFRASRTEERPAPDGVIYFGFPPVAGNIYFCKLIAGFSQRFPDIKLSIHEEGSHRIMADIDAGMLDVGCVLRPVPERKYACADIGRDTSCLVVSRRHPLAEREWVDLEELREEKFILLGTDFRIHDDLGAACRKLGFEPKVVQTSAQWDYIIQMVRLNTGITFLPDSLLKCYAIPDVAVLNVRELSLSEELVLITGKNAYHSSRVDQFISYVVQHVAGSVD